MELHFTKMHGCGNDYIYFDCFQQPIFHPEELSIRLSDRHKSVGGDGIVLICPSEIADVKMRMFNADGSEGKMCGNAIRCIGKYVYEHGYVKHPSVTVETLSGIKHLTLLISGRTVQEVTVDMGKASFQAKSVPVLTDKEEMVHSPLSVNGREFCVTCLSMGNPHCVVYCDDPDLLKMEDIGSSFENHPLFPEKINTEFIQVIDPHTLKMRVWERGSGETMACGTGACAAVAASVKNGFCPENEEITVLLRGGALKIRYTPEHVIMTGGAEIAFQGIVEEENQA